MKLLPYMVGMNFGEGQDGQLYVLGLLAPSNELACAHAVSTVMQVAKIEKPLTRIIWQELEEAFLVEALKGLRGEAGSDTKVVSLRAVEPEPTLPQPAPVSLPCNHEWVSVPDPSDRFASFFTKCRWCGERQLKPPPMVS